MRPGLFRSAVGLGESAFFGIPGGRSLNKQHCAAVLLAAVEHTIGEGDGALSDVLLLSPNLFASLEILAHQALALRVTVEVIANLHHAAMVVGHGLVGIYLRGGEIA